MFLDQQVDFGAQLLIFDLLDKSCVAVKTDMIRASWEKCPGQNVGKCYLRFCFLQKALTSSTFTICPNNILLFFE